MKLQKFQMFLEKKKSRHILNFSHQDTDKNIVESRLQDYSLDHPNV